MKETERLADQLKRAFEGGAWHGPAVSEVLDQISAEQAAARPIPGAHTIWEIALHIAAWEGAGLRRLRGDRAQLPTEEDWPAISDTSKDAWEETLAKLKSGHQQLQAAIAELEESRLNDPIVDGMSSIYVTLHGVVQHDIYHAGQIAILKKALSGEKR